MDVTNTHTLSRRNSAPSTIGRVDEDHEENKSYRIQRQSSYGNLIRKFSPKDSVKTRKDVPNLPPFKNPFRGLTGLHSNEEFVSFEKRRQPWLKGCPKFHTNTDLLNLPITEESNVQTKFHSTSKNTGTSFDDSSKSFTTLGRYIKEEKRALLKHPISKQISIFEKESDTESKASVQYFYYKAKHFQHFHYVYNLMRTCHERIEALGRINHPEICMVEDVIIKIGIVGFTEDKFNLLSKRRGKSKMPPRSQQIWGQSPLLCFQKSTKTAFEMLRSKKACHKILIISDPNQNETEILEDSIYIIREDKEDILKAISVCLEKQIHQILEDWLLKLPVEGFSNYLPGLVEEINDIRKEMLFDENDHTNGSTVAFPGVVNELLVPSNVKEYLLGRNDVNSFGIWKNSLFKVFAKKTIDKKELTHELKKLHHHFFENYHLEIVKGRLVTVKTLKQGDLVQSNQDEINPAATLGGFVTKTDDERKIYALTCSHAFPKEKLLAYTDKQTGKDIGTCVFTKHDSSCDFAAIEINKSFANECDVALRREDNKKIGAKVYNESLERTTFVHKIGATTNVTKGRIISSEYYNKDLPENIFLVKGIGKNFSEPGDSGSLVFSRPKTGRQNYVNVIGMVFANNFMLYDDVDDSDDDHNGEKEKDLESSQMADAKAEDNDQNIENLSCCYRIHTALDLFEEERGVQVKFKDDLSTPSSSPDDSFEEDC